MVTAEAQPTLHLTPAAIRRLGELAGKHVRLEILPGGCSGFDLRFTESAPQPDDASFGPEGAALLVDPVSLGLIAGATVDHSGKIGREGFTVDNIPGLEARCGCGTSFSLKE